jgi:hypothetical protein
VVFEKSGHSPQIEEAAAFQELVRGFLSEALDSRERVREPNGHLR